MLEDLLLELLRDSVELTSRSILMLGEVPDKLKSFYVEEDLEVIEDIEQKKRKELDKFIRRIDKNSKNEMNFDELMKYGSGTARALELIPDPEECRRIYEVHKGAFERGTKKFDENIRNLGLIDGVMNLTRAGVSVVYDPILTGCYLLGGALGMSSKLKKNKFPLYTALGSVTASLSSMSLYHMGFSGSEDMNPWAMLYLSVFDDITTIPIIAALGFYGTSEKRNQTKLNEIESAIPNYERVMQHSIIIPEMVRNLRYARNTIDSNRLSSDFFDDELRGLEDIIRRYYQGDAEVEEVIESRLKYVPQRDGKKAKSDKSKTTLPRKISMSPEEYQRRREKGEFGAFRNLAIRLGKVKSREPEKVLNSPQIQDEIGFTFVHNREGEIGGYPVTRLEDVIQTKIRDSIASKGRLETIRKSGNGATLIEQYNPNGPLYKMQPLGALRVLYSRDGQEIFVHDILTHEEYERKMSS